MASLLFPSKASAQDREDVVLVEQNVLFAVDLDLRARVLAEEDAVALLHVERADLAVLEDLAAARRDDHPFDRLLLGRIGDDDAPLRFLFLGQALDHDAVGKGTDFHELLNLRGDGAPARFVGPRRGWASPRGGRA